MSFELSDRDVELIDVALTSAIDACRGMRDSTLVSEYTHALRVLRKQSREQQS